MNLARGGNVNTGRLAKLGEGELVWPFNGPDEMSQWLREQPEFKYALEQLKNQAAAEGRTLIVGHEQDNMSTVLADEIAGAMRTSMMRMSEELIKGTGRTDVVPTGFMKNFR